MADSAISEENGEAPQAMETNADLQTDNNAPSKST